MPESVVLSRDQIFEKLRDILEEALGADEEEITIEASLTGDLEAESIDFLDIVFRLEKAFDVKIPREELFPAENIISNPEYIDNGKVTEKGLEIFKEQMPHTDFSDFAADPDVNKIADLFTVNSVVNFIELKLS